MARRALTFGIRLRDKARGQTLRIRASRSGEEGYVVEHHAEHQPARRRRHARLEDAVADGARIWRHRLH